MEPLRQIYDDWHQAFKVKIFHGDYLSVVMGDAKRGVGDAKIAYRPTQSDSTGFYAAAYT